MPREVSFATFNLYNLQRPGKYVYRSKVKKADYDAKVAWSAVLLKDAMPDVVAFQELWAPECLEDVFAKAGLKNKYRLRYIGDSWGGIAVAAAARNPWKIVGFKVHKAFPDGFKLLKRKRSSQEDADRHDDDIEVSIDRFSRTIIQLTVKHQDGKVPPIEVFCVHLKAKLPTNLDREDKNDPVLMAHANALGAAISTIRRTAEAAALRVLLNGIMNDTETPVVVMGDYNDGLLSNTLSIITGQPPYKLFQAKKVSKAKKSVDIRDRGLYSASMLQQYHSLRDVHYSHNYQGVNEVLDHILVSEQFYDHSPNRIWSFKAARIWNDHVDDHDPREGGSHKTVSDHGVVKAEFVFDPA